MKQILVIHTGGTIAMEEDVDTGTVAHVEDNPLLNQRNDEANFIIRQPFHLPSPHISPVHMLQLKELIEEECKDQKIDGVVITHGTDTMEETAYFLDLTVQVDVPIVVTGAMRSSNEIGSEGLANFMAAIRVASSDKARRQGVLVVMNDEIHAALHVTKMHANNVSSFQSPQAGPIGAVAKQNLLFYHGPRVREKFDVNVLTKRVALFKAYAGMDADLLDAIKDLGYDGVVVEAFGQGNLPPDVAIGIEKLIQAKIPVVLVSRCTSGIVQDVYTYAGGGKQLKDSGVIFSNGLNGQKARIKLLVALEGLADLRELDGIFLR